MKISVALCTYNGARHLEEQINSILGQTLPPDEIVICDDRSTDDTVPLLRRLAERSPVPIRIEVNAVNLGVVGNFGRAIDLCRHEIICLSDQDDAWLPDKNRRMHDRFAADPKVLAVFGDAAVADEELRPNGEHMLAFSLFGEEQVRRLRSGDQFSVMMTRSYVVGATLAIRASLRPLLLPFPAGDATMLHDRWIALVASALGGLDVIDEDLILYRQHAAQAVGTTDPQRDLAATLSRSERLDGLRARFQQQAASFTKLQERLHDRPELSKADIDLLASRIRHLQSRGSMPRSAASRVWAVGREWMSGRYDRHSRGWRSAIRDLAGAMI